MTTLATSCWKKAQFLDLKNEITFCTSLENSLVLGLIWTFGATKILVLFLIVLELYWKEYLVIAYLINVK